MTDKEADEQPDEFGPMIEGRHIGYFWHEMFDADGKHADHETLLIAARRRKVASLYAENLSLAEIAARIEPKVSVMTIWRDVRACFNWLKQASARTVAEHLAFAMMRLDWLEAEITEQWQRSKGARMKTQGTKKAKPRPKKDDDEESKPTFSYAEESSRFERIETYGDPRLFAEMRKIWELRVEMFGLIKREIKDRESGSGESAPERVKLVAGPDPMALV